jgi:hypothetical protein
MGKRNTSVMVPDDDPSFVRFWNAFPRREAKKDARKAWAALAPSVDLAERIVAALEWQVPAFRWDGEKRDFCPLPATYLRNERWTDERREAPRPPTLSTAVGDPMAEWLRNKVGA